MKFYFYVKENYPVFEPAEGGYYVSASEITECEEFYCVEDVMDHLLNRMIDQVEKGDKLDWGTLFIGFKKDVDGKTVLSMPVLGFNYGKYIGDGYTMGVATEKPMDKPYEGYC